MHYALTVDAMPLDFVYRWNLALTVTLVSRIGIGCDYATNRDHR